MPTQAENFWEKYGAARADRARTGAREDAPGGTGDGAAPGAEPGAEPNDGSSGPATEQAATEAAVAAEEHECLDWCPICRGAEVLRAGAPPELRSQLAAAQRDSLMMLRALIDSYLDRTPPTQAGPGAADGGVEDIPIG